MKKPTYNARELAVLEAPEAFLFRRRDGIGATRLESRRPVEKGEDLSTVWQGIVAALKQPPFAGIGIGVYAVRTMRDGEHLAAVSLTHNPWEA